MLWRDTKLWAALAVAAGVWLLSGCVASPTPHPASDAVQTASVDTGNGGGQDVAIGDENGLFTGADTPAPPGADASADALDMAEDASALDAMADEGQADEGQADEGQEDAGQEDEGQADEGQEDAGQEDADEVADGP